ncbi:MAG: Na(+)-translocating NADH-quinone reductase subunit A [Paracoccus sp. (in: a-proteobacteria)]|nr:Na(+)-translocating NADH-quinone reductase subunit A [Paracoccus sp. (in: a-proteobacteria)]
MSLLLRRGLKLPIESPPAEAGAPQLALTDESALGAGFGRDFRVDPLVKPGDQVAQGAPLMRARRQPELALTAPVGGKIARLDLGAGRALSQIVIFRDADADRREYATGDQSPEALRALLLETGLWTGFRSRPFGAFPASDQVAAAIFVTAHDTRPLAAPTRVALKGAEEFFARGIEALSRLTEGPVFVIQDRGADLVPASGRVRILRAGNLHPGGLAGGYIHRLRPASHEARIWEIDAQEVAAIGSLLAEGLVPETRVVSVAGPGLARGRLVRCQIGADMRELVQGLLTPGPRAILSGALPGALEARHLRLRDRQVTVVPRRGDQPRRHWFRAALSRAARPMPVIPTIAAEQALAGGIPAMALMRALSSGDLEGAVALGALSLLEEDMELLDYVTDAEPGFKGLLRTALDEIAREEGA